MKINTIKKLMKMLALSITGKAVSIIDTSEHSPNSLDAYSTTKNVGEPLVALPLSNPFPGQSKEKRSSILYGFFGHEIMHLIRTDFDYFIKELSNYDPKEQKIRKEFFNILEDASIEYFARWDLPKHLYTCVLALNEFLYKRNSMLQDFPNAFVQYMAALCMFSQSGILKGEFTFDSALEAFKKTAGIMLQAIENPDCKERFRISQDIFEMVCPLWLEQQEDIFANAQLKELFENLGVKDSTGTGGALTNELPQSFDEKSTTAANERRKKILHLVDSLENTTSGNGIPLDKMPDELYAAQSMNGQSPGKVLSGYSIHDERTKMDQSIPSGKSSDAKEKLKELMDELAADQKSVTGSEDYKEAMQQMHSMESSAEKLEQADRKIEERKNKLDDCDLKIESPYFKAGDVQYGLTYPTLTDTQPYEKIYQEVKNDISGFQYGLKKIFEADRVKKIYSTSGKINPSRAAGIKKTARIFQKKSLPDNKEEMAVVLLVDQSGSMRSDMYEVKKVALLLLEGFAKFNVPIKVIGFSSIKNEADYIHYGKWSNSRDMRRCAMQMEARGGTFLGHAIRYGGSFLKRRNEKNKLFIIITDGEPCSGVYETKEKGLSDCRFAVEEIRRFASVIGVNLGSESKQFNYVFQKDCLCISDSSELVKILPKQIEKIIKKF